MKTETQIVKEYTKQLKEWNIDNTDFSEGELRVKCFTHLASCQRFLEFIRNMLPFPRAREHQLFEEKLQDLRQAIKIYEDGGVR